jgi:hypothetical protein
MTTLTNLIGDIEHDLHGVSPEIHAVLTRHLTLRNVAGHLADTAAALAAPPIGPLLETLVHLPPDIQGIVAEVAAGLADRLTNHQAQTIPAPETAPTA